MQWFHITDTTLVELEEAMARPGQRHSRLTVTGAAVDFGSIRDLDTMNDNIVHA